LPFATPTGAAGSGLTVIVGPNNSGKSTVFDALLKLSKDKKIPESQRTGDGDVMITLTDTDGKRKVIRNIGGGSQIEISGESTLNPGDIEFIAPRRHWSHEFTCGAVEYHQYLDQRFRTGRALDFDRTLGGLLSEINRTQSEKRAFCDLMKQLIGDFADWTIDTMDEEAGDYVKYKTPAGTIHHAGLLGDGVISLFRVVAHLCKTKGHLILLIDEPELSLHPQAQHRLAELLAHNTSDKQIIICTHSPHFVRWCDIKNGAQVIRLHKKPDEGCRPYRLDIGKGYENLLNLAEDWQKPHLMDAVSKEIFFAENVVFVEGQEDVGLLSKYIADNAIETSFGFFGYGSGGKGNIHLFLQMSRDLGLNAGAIFDGDSLEEVKRCEEDFPDFCIKQISAPDIRDKHKSDQDGNESAEPRKEGLFDRHGHIKTGGDEELRRIISDLTKHFRFDS